MGLFEKIFGRFLKRPNGSYDGRLMLLNGREAYFPRFDGRIYEAQRVRSAIDALARNIGKLQITVEGSAKPITQTYLKRRPNVINSWYQFMYRLATIYYNENNAVIVPVEDEKWNVTGLYPLLPKRCEIWVYDGIPYLRYRLHTKEYAAIELDRVGIMTRFQYEDDLRGEGNEPLHSTMDLIGIQEQGIKEGVKNSASYKFMASLSNYTKPEDLKKERKRFTEMNLAKDAEGGGVLLFPNTYVNAKQIEMKPFVVDADTVKMINDSVNQYFGVNEKVLQNEAVGDAWSAFYEGAIEPFAIQFSEVVTNMLFTQREQASGSKIMATSNRLQYMSNKEKLEVTTQLVDRGIMTINDALNVWNLPEIENGDVRVIRGEYVNANERTKSNEQ